MLVIDHNVLEEIRTSGKAMKVRKTAPSWAKEATLADWQQGFVSPGVDKPHQSGVCETLEGPKSFQVGDMICRGLQGEFWPMNPTTFHTVKVQAVDQPPDQDGFLTYFNSNTVWAIQITEDFVVTAGHEEEPLHQKANAYLIFNETGCWPLDEKLFPQTYSPV